MGSTQSIQQTSPLLQPQYAPQYQPELPQYAPAPQQQQYAPPQQQYAPAPQQQYAPPQLQAPMPQQTRPPRQQPAPMSNGGGGGGTQTYEALADGIVSGDQVTVERIKQAFIEVAGSRFCPFIFKDTIQAAGTFITRKRNDALKTAQDIGFINANGGINNRGMVKWIDGLAGPDGFGLRITGAQVSFVNANNKHWFVLGALLIAVGVGATIYYKRTKK